MAFLPARGTGRGSPFLFLTAGRVNSATTRVLNWFAHLSAPASGERSRAPAPLIELRGCRSPLSPPLHTVPSLAVTLAAGARLGPYEIVAPIGAGGMGEVYRAKDPRLGRDVAIKVLPASFSADPDRLGRFEREARAAGALNHPNITSVYDIGSMDGAPYVVSELLDGETLRDVLDGEQLSVRRAMDYAGQIAEGLAAAHEKGIVHRDLKPENLVVTRGGRVKILDFGLAKLIRPDGATGDVTEGPTLSAGTEPGVILGTVGYMSPEQVRGQNADHRSDIFAFGAILHEMLTGQRAFRRDSAVETLTAILREEPPDISQTNQAISPSLDHIVRRCLEKRPEERFHSARDLAFALREVSSGPPTPGAAPRVGWPRRGVFLFAAAGIVLLALALGFTVGGWGKRLTGSAKPAAIQSLAVLPLANLSGDPEQEYFADGMTEALITSLAQLSGLRVISRTSVMQYKNVRKPLTEIARELKVEGIVEGSVMRAGARVRITAQLIQAATDKHLWAQDYERDLRDVLTLQSEVARAIAREVQVKIGPEEQGRLKKSQRVNPSAYEAYLKGRYHWNKRTEEGIKTGVSFFEQAIQLDPTYAPAYAGVADSYTVLQSHRFVPSAEAHPKAKAAARKALEIDETLSEAHASMASVLWDDLDWIGAEREFQRAIQTTFRRAEGTIEGKLCFSFRHRSRLYGTGRKRTGVRVAAEGLRGARRRSGNRQSGPGVRRHSRGFEVCGPGSMHRRLTLGPGPLDRARARVDR